MIENIGLSFQGIWAHKMRSFLTMLGIIIGIAAIITIVSTITGTNNQIKQNLVGSGNNAVNIMLYNGDYAYDMTYESVPTGIPIISEDTLTQIADLNEVEAVTSYTKRQASYNYSVFYNSLSLAGGTLYGTNSSYFDVYGYKVQQGRGFLEEDFTEYRAVAIIDTTTAKVLFQGEDPIGKTLEISSVPYTIVGVVKQTSDSKPVINSVDDFYNYSGNASGNVFVPDTTWPCIFNYDEPQNVAVKATSTDDMTAAGKQTADILNSNVTNTSGIAYQSEDLLEQAKELQELSNSTNQMLLWIASISLLVGGIGVMNIMLVSVTERTREIGLKKALGAKKSRILWQFLTEAAVLTSLGGLLGVGVGIGLAFVISSVAEIPVAISIPSIILSVVFSMVVGIVFGILPSVKASNLNPIEALRYE